MKDLRQFLLDCSYSDIRTIFAKHLLWSKENNRVSGKPRWFDEPGTLNVIGIDCDSNGNPADDEIEFNLGKYKDFLVLIYNKPNDAWDMILLEVTLDPGKDAYNRMHLMPGMYDAYRVGIHGLSSGRTKTMVEGVGSVTRHCLRQDRNKVYIVRTDGSGKGGKKSILFSGFDMPYSNIHDPNQFIDPSAGCTVFKRVLDWYKKFLPYIWNVQTGKPVPVNHDNITYAVIHHSQLEKYSNELIKREELAEAVNGVDTVATSQPGSATKIK